MDPLSSQVRDAYDDNAELYASLFSHDLDNDHQTTRLLAQFAELARHLGSPVIDVGCGPGSVVHHLSGLGLEASGLDISAGQIAQARLAFPGLRFEVGDLARLDLPDCSLGGIVSRYSIIHAVPGSLPAVFGEWHRALESLAPLFISFFGSRSSEAHGTPFDHKVTTAYELCPATVEQLLSTAGFTNIETQAVALPPGGRPFDHTTILAQKT